MSHRTGEILVSIGLLLLAAGNYCMASSVCILYNEVNSLNREVSKLNRDVRDLYTLNEYNQTKLWSLEKKISPPDSDHFNEDEELNISVEL